MPTGIEIDTHCKSKEYKFLKLLSEYAVFHSAAGKFDG